MFFVISTGGQSPEWRNLHCHHLDPSAALGMTFCNSGH